MGMDDHGYRKFILIAEVKRAALVVGQ